MNVRLTKDQKVKLLYPEDIYKVMQQVLLRENKIRRNQEHFWVIGLDNKKKILFIELVALGRVYRVNVNPPDVFRMGIYKLAVTMVLVHNHPSGDTSPSQADRDFTDRLLKVGKLINIDVIDHLVISEETFYSFARAGVLDELKKSGLYEVVQREKVVMTSMKNEAEQRKKALAIAKKLKGMGMNDKDIKKATGLYMYEIRGL